MRTGTIALLIGVFLLQLLAELPTGYLVIFLPVALSGIFLTRRHTFRLLAWGMLGFLWALLHAQLWQSQRLPAAFAGRDLIIDGYIASIPDTYPDSTRFEFDVLTVRDPAQAQVPRRVRLSWRQAEHEKLQAGDHWQLTVRLKQPRGFYNPGSFDYEAWLLQHQIGATGYVRPEGDNQRLSSGWWPYPVQRLRQVILQRINTALADQPFRNVIAALVLGVQSELSEEQWRVFRVTGTAHLIAISGLHISLIAGLVFFLCRRAWARSFRLTTCCAAPRAAAVLAILAAGFYCALAGFSIPTQRSLVMIVVVFGFIALLRESRPSYTLAIALLAVLLWDPFAVLTIGFWLSYGAVAIILFMLSGRRSPQALWWQSIKLQVAISIGLIPLLIAMFEQVPVLSPLANLVAVPLVTYVIVPLALIGTCLLFIWSFTGEWLLLACHYLLNALWWLLEGMANLPLASVAIPYVSGVALTLALLGLGLMGLPRGLPARWLGLLGLLPLLFPTLPRPNWGEAHVTLLDVGQGLSVVVETQQHVLVFDTGPRFSDRFDTGKAVIVPYLHHRGWRSVDTLIISHGDNDHIGGAASLAEQIPVQQILTSVPEQIDWAAVTVCRAGQQWDWEGVHFLILHPVSYDDHLGRAGNNHSCVLRVSLGEQHVLLTADIEAIAERQLLVNAPQQLAADILVVPHHGSKTSSTLAFIQQIQPRYALFAVGQANRFGFPHPSVAQRYHDAGITLLDTAHSGAIEFKLQSQLPLAPPRQYRMEMMRYWHQP